MGCFDYWFGGNQFADAILCRCHAEGFEAIDNDGDSVDSDGDLYPDGQERLYGTNPFSELSHPGLFDPQYRLMTQRNG